MTLALTIIHVAVSIFMILVILLQAGKSGGIGIAGGSSSAFGGRGQQTILSKITTVSATVFMVTSLTLAWFSSRSESMVVQRQLAAQEKAAAAAAATKTDDAAKTDEAAPAADAPKADEAAPAADAPADQPK